MEEVNLTKKERRELAREEKENERIGQEKTKKLRGIFIGLIVLGVIGFVGYKTYKFFTTPAPAVLPQSIELTDSDWIRGDKNSKAILIEYGDFQCPACANYFPLVEKLSQDITSDFTFVYRQFPLTTIHPNAMPAAKAAEAAGKQGKFWEMYKILYEKQDEWAEDRNAKDKFTSYAEELSLNKDQFLSDFDNSQTEEDVKADMLSGNRLNVDSTPTFFLNGKKVQPKSYDQFKKLIEDEIRGYTTN
ncbi:hypothetical protein A2962_04180 [Candidatus Woesebacteria bacterium RIFCSPLOWO2_01_FULL_39_61]|uniref:Thioredoxin domain-containing protein n=1 Tax=Candidatus Woesebacteria bacterium RIFCSPHIGHO2_02_FULL_39_13 TaxID=1802505 RepID=A0A1F7YY04_9BACT|nr:MAG: hypothetical protein A2692_00535 [Candidatus Woesebacteria bacterium RIFCSPHIGHO2_01_FULL_39_95]OGM32161.1 MAG: hypothetical protein A3D01_02120 [Candidatus Woesebacteria bacterium RIFCSPHIGHO2_02_FULL_39_13]OGM36610.1 MAG: hypothetical protein A3E13_02955 [Candidatus Woesebacteria bacterium RIFCSPHIGHO2_12_FULL_40_20]OGM65951.1 MAG: hypothetical protein A2962_04180 [Candidatus Woesebacteria bacterium RIFCSPLOWO2_01_FULL_39_61]OGM71407.1 MAG: hypothetical protein A3H19_04550 [Candidatus